MKRHLLALALLLVLPLAAEAGSFVYDGWILYNTDIVMLNFTLNNDATNVRIWTDSFMNGQNFDPMLAVFGPDGTLLAQNDDDPNVGPNQTYWDAGLVFPTLAAGNYKCALTAYWNFANGPNLSDGFELDGTQPVPIEQWWAGGAGYWRANFDGVDNASPVPEPATAGLLGIGLASMGLLASRGFRKKNR